jgi:hypothetical protein
MKKLFLSACLLLSVITLSSQTIKVEKSYRLPNDNRKGFHPVLNAAGDLLAFTTESYDGLNIYDFSNQSVQTISGEQGAGFQPVFSNDGKLFYKNTVYKSNLKYEGLKCYDLKSKNVKEALEPQRNLKLVQKSDTSIMVIAGKKPLKIASGKPEKTISLSVWSDGQNLTVYRNEICETLNPVKNANGYIWASLSTNGKMILFNAVAVGTFVSDLKGNIIASLGYLNAPVWYGNEFVIGMQDKDDGYNITASKVIMKNLAGNITKQLSRSDQIALFPTASSVAGKVAYNTTEGDIYVLELTITK